MKLSRMSICMLITMLSYAHPAWIDQVGITIDRNIDWIAQLNWYAYDQPYPVKSTPIALERPLFNYYPALRASISCVDLCDLPTPVHQLRALGHELGLKQLYVKQDDLTGRLNGQERLFGGNKPRKLEFLLADAIAHGAHTVLTFGCVGSSHAVATAQYASLLGMRCIVMLKPQPNSSVVRAHLLQHAYLESEIHYYLDNDSRRIGTISAWHDAWVRTGSYPYIIKTGGSTVRGVLGFVNAALELKEQIAAGMLPCPRYLYVPCGSPDSGATAVGLALGFKLAQLPIMVVAVATEPEPIEGLCWQAIGTLFKETNDFLCMYDASIDHFNLTHNDVRVKLGFTGSGYGEAIDAGTQAIALMCKQEGIILEQTYTAKALACLVEDVRSGRIKADAPVLFWNTYCGLDFSTRLNTVDYRQLPLALHDFFTQV